MKTFHFETSNSKQASISKVRSVIRAKANLQGFKIKIFILIIKFTLYMDMLKFKWFLTTGILKKNLP